MNRELNMDLMNQEPETVKLLSETDVISILIIVFIVYKIWKIIFNNKKESHQNSPDNHKRFEECPRSAYPNGWQPILDSRELKTNEVKPVFAFGYDLIAYRGVSGKVYVMDAYCPHLGANLGVGGTVIGEEIKCPFHGWKFNNEGKCTYIPGIEMNTAPKAQVKVWDSHEINGFINVWHHSEGKEPNWSLKPIEDINNKQFVYKGTYETEVNVHIQEVQENNSDVMHIKVLHGVPEFMAYPVEPGSFNEYLLTFLKIEVEGHWKPWAEPDQHISQLNTTGHYNFGFFKISYDVETKLIGPGLIEVLVTLFKFIKVKSVLATMAKGPRLQRCVLHYYSDSSSILSYVLAHYWPHFFGPQFERDIKIWNTKKYLAKPYLTKIEADIKAFRRWYKQFYPETEK